MLIQVAVPSRVDVEEYQHLQSTVNELVGKINGIFLFEMKIDFFG